MMLSQKSVFFGAFLFSCFCSTLAASALFHDHILSPIYMDTIFFLVKMLKKYFITLILMEKKRFCFSHLYKIKKTENKIKII